MSKPIIDVTQQGTGLVDPLVVNPGPVSPFAGSPGQPQGPGDNPGPGIMPPVPGTPRPGDPPPTPEVPAPPTTPSPTVPPAPSPPKPTMEE